MGLLSSSENLPKTGQPAPGFHLRDQDGKFHDLNDYKGTPIVLYFYPKDDTPGCTIEARGFRDAAKQYEDAGLKVLGVSLDKVASHKKWAEKMCLTFTLLADEEGDVAERYGVRRGLGPLTVAARVTFLIDREGKVAKIWKSVDPRVHADDVLASARSLGLAV